MIPAFRPATRDEVADVIGLLSADAPAVQTGHAGIDPYLSTFDAMRAGGTATVIVGLLDGRIVATYQIAILLGLSLTAERRAQVESVRVAAHLRGKGLGTALMADAEVRARAAGCTLIQLTTANTRERAHAFYSRLGFTTSHIGFKRKLT